MVGTICTYVHIHIYLQTYTIHVYKYIYICVCIHATVNIIDGRAIRRMDMGFYMGAKLCTNTLMWDPARDVDRP